VTDVPDIEAAYQALRDGAAARPLGRDVVRVAGPDAAPYLQGQLSQEVEGLEEGAARESLILSPQGRVDAYVRVARLGPEEFVLDTEGGFGPAVVSRLERFRLRTKVDIDELDWVCVGVRGPESPGTVTGAPVVRIAVAWPGLAGVDLLGPGPGRGGTPFVADDVTVCPPEAWEAARIEAGEPVLGREIDERTIAAEVGLVERTVSFTKGCFTGQELVARLDARGSKVARRLRGVVVEAGGGGLADAARLRGASVRTAEGAHGGADGEEGGREAGRLTSVAWSPGLGAGVGLAVLHRSVNPPEPVVLRPDGADGRSVRAEARTLPLKPGG